MNTEDEYIEEYVKEEEYENNNDEDPYSKIGDIQNLNEKDDKELNFHHL
jgi:hypothetical protein